MAENDEVFRNGMRADVTMMLEGLAWASHMAREHQRMQEEVLKRHDLVAADRDWMIQALDKVGAMTPGVKNVVNHNSYSKNTEANTVFMQNIHNQAVHIMEAHKDQLRSSCCSTAPTRMWPCI